MPDARRLMLIDADILLTPIIRLCLFRYAKDAHDMFFIIYAPICRY